MSLEKKWNTNNWELFSLPFFDNDGSANTVVRRIEGYNRETGWATALRHGLHSPRYDSDTTKNRNMLEELTTSKMTQGKDPDELFAEMGDLRIRLKNMEEVVSDDRFEDIIVQSIANDYDCVRQTSKISIASPTLGSRKLKHRRGTCTSAICLFRRPSRSRAEVWHCRPTAATSASAASTAGNTGTTPA